jgi:hypothetical protein
MKAIENIFLFFNISGEIVFIIIYFDICYFYGKYATKDKEQKLVG